MFWTYNVPSPLNELSPHAPTPHTKWVAPPPFLQGGQVWHIVPEDITGSRNANIFKYKINSFYFLSINKKKMILTSTFNKDFPHNSPLQNSAS